MERRRGGGATEEEEEERKKEEERGLVRVRLASMRLDLLEKSKSP